MSELPGRLFAGVYGRLLKEDVTPALSESLAQSGLELHALKPAYPKSQWFSAAGLTAKALFPNDAPGEQLRKFGAHVIGALQSRGILKGPWLSMAKLLGPRRALKQAFEFADRSPVKVSLTERSKTEFEFFIDAAEQPEFFVGLLEAALVALGAKRPVVRALAQPGTFLASWH